MNGRGFFLWMCGRNEIYLLTLKELEMVSIGLRSLFMVKTVLGLLLPVCMTSSKRGVRC